jgi:hypothetical protein
VEEDAAAAEALAADDAQGGTGAGVAVTPPLVDFEDLGPAAGKSRALSDGLWAERSWRHTTSAQPRNASGWSRGSVKAPD